MFTEELSHNHNTAAESPPPPSSQLERVWQGLIANRCKVVRSGVTAESHYFEVASVPSSRATSLPACKQQLLVAVLLGHRQKSFAIDAECAQSTISAHLGDCLQTFGLHRQSHRLPLLLFVMARVLYGKLSAQCLQIEKHDAENGSGWLVQSCRPEIWLSRLLSESETAVISYRVQGHSYAEIAAERRTSARTVANQIASAYAKLRISGRSELLCYLAERLEVFEHPARV